MCAKVSAYNFGMNIFTNLLQDSESESNSEGFLIPNKMNLFNTANIFLLILTRFKTEDKLQQNCSINESLLS